MKKIFWWASGADIDVLKDYPTEHSKYFGIGGTIIFTALMASFAGGYAFFTAFKSIIFSVFFGIFWGSMIFNLDRYIVSTFGVGDGKKTISKQELIEASPRILMAILLGFVIATPLELKIFKQEIDVEIESIKKDIRSGMQKQDSVYFSGALIIQQEIAKLQQESRDIESGNMKTVESRSISTINNEIAEKKKESLLNKI